MNVYSNYYQAGVILPEKLLIQKILTSSAVHWLHFMPTCLPANVANPHHALIFDVVRTNTGNAYHSSTGVFMTLDNIWMQSTCLVVAHTDKGDDVFLKSSGTGRGD